MISVLNYFPWKRTLSNVECSLRSNLFEEVLERIFLVSDSYSQQKALYGY